MRTVSRYHGTFVNRNGSPREHAAGCMESRRASSPRRSGRNRWRSPVKASSSSGRNVREAPPPANNPKVLRAWTCITTGASPRPWGVRTTGRPPTAAGPCRSYMMAAGSDRPATIRPSSISRQGLRRRQSREAVKMPSSTPEPRGSAAPNLQRTKPRSGSQPAKRKLLVFKGQQDAPAHGAVLPRHAAAGSQARAPRGDPPGPRAPGRPDAAAGDRAECFPLRPGGPGRSPRRNTRPRAGEGVYAAAARPLQYGSHRPREGRALHPHERTVVARHESPAGRSRDCRTARFRGC